MSEKQDTWTFAEGEGDGSALRIRFRNFDPAFPKANFVDRLNIFWKMEEEDDKGLPTEAETERMELFENRLCGAVEIEGQGVLSMVLTGKGHREYVFHTPDPKLFISRLSQIPHDGKKYPIDIKRIPDPRWEYDDRVKKGLAD